MKKTITLFVLVLLTAMSQRAVAQIDTIYPPYTPDTVVFGDSNYFFMPRHGKVLERYTNHFVRELYPGRNSVVILCYPFYTDTPLSIYGIAWPLYHSDNILDFCYYLIQKDKLGKLRILDSVCLHRPATNKCFRFKSTNYRDSSRIAYQTLPIYEGYFEEAITVTDTFFIGVAYEYHSPYYYNYLDSLSYNNWRYYYMTSQYLEHHLLSSMIASHYYTNDTNDITLVGNLWRNNDSVLYWDRINTPQGWGTYPVTLPIIKPGAPYIDSVACHDTVKGFELYTQHDGIAGFTWDTLLSALWLFSRTTGYQVSCGPAENDIEDNEIRTIWGNRHVAGFTGLEPNREYKASIRTRCHHHCNAHDTTVWGAWQTPIHFTTGDTVDIALPEDAANDIMLLPNPADEQVTLRATLPITHLTLCDLQGNILLSLTPQQNELTLPLHHYPQGTYLLSLTTQKGTTVKKLIRRQ